MTFKNQILKHICYTDLVYERVNKKLNSKYSRTEIEEMILSIIKKTQDSQFEKKGKNIYITNIESNVILTVNYSSNRLITLNRIKK